MRSALTVLCIVVLCAIPGIGFSQLVWTRCPQNPVLVAEPGGWDSQEVRAPSMVFEGEGYETWYTGQPSVASEAICRATSGDGIAWTKYSSNPVLRRTDIRALDPSVLFLDRIWKMWYGGTTYHQQVFYASSEDGINWDWQSHPDPVLRAGDPGEWDDAHAQHPSVVYVNGVYHMYYEGTQTGYYWGTGGIGHATSRDGIVWTKDPANPVLRPGSPGSWDDYSLYTGGRVTWDGTDFHLWYVGMSSATARGQIGHATSADGSAWVKDADNPVLMWGAPGEWDDRFLESPSAMRHDGEWMLWYTAHSSLHSSRSIGLATAPDTSMVVGWMTPEETVVRRGGSLDYTYHLRNNTSRTLTFNYWATATSPEGHSYGPLGKRVTLGPGESLEARVHHPIPGDAALGAYTYAGYVGWCHPRELWDSDCFTFTVVR